MPPIKGRLGDRKNATIDLVDRTITVITKGGFFGGNATNSEISLDDVKSIEYGTGIKPFPDAMMVKIKHASGELTFYSINKNPLQKLAESASEYVEKRAKLLEEMENEFERDREAHVALMYLNLELVDALMELVVLLEGSVDWEAVEAQLTQVERVNQDRDNLPYMRPSRLGMEQLTLEVNERSTDLIKSEIYNLVSVLHQSCVEKAKHREPWFNTGLHQLFMEALMVLWNRRLEALTGVSMGEEPDKDELRFLELRKLVVQETGDEETESIDLFSRFSDLRIILYEWVEGLQNVGFEPGEELERRLVA
jgi:hypothetical protein